MFFGDAPWRVGHGDLKDGLCQIDSEVRSVHEDSSPGLGLRGRLRVCWHIGAVSGEESIPSVAGCGHLRRPPSQPSTARVRNRTE
jgi:hypothetical protein